MNYQRTLDYLMNQLPMYQRIGKLAYRTGLDNTIKLDNYFRHPHTNFITIHVAGTNGKGSVSHLLASILQESGYRVGLYTSPHLIDFRERIKVNGKMISRKFVTDFVLGHKAFFDTLNASFFEISVFLAFTCFVQCKVDIAVIEVGLGGRLDATNIISPVLSVITNIGKDHTEILGDTLEKIAGEKAGIIKNNVPVVIGESHPETLPVFRQSAQIHQSSLLVADTLYAIPSSFESADGYQVFDVMRDGVIRFERLKCGLLGHYQRQNTITVLAAVEQLIAAGIRIQEEAIYKGISNIVMNTGLAGRWQVISTSPQIVCDTAHNTEGLKQVLQQVAETPFNHLHLVIGFVNDKDIHDILMLMPPHAYYYFTRLSVPRTMNEGDLAMAASHLELKGQIFSTIKDAFHAAKRNAGIHDLIIITGSTFLVGDFLTMNNEQ
jgi:dihydrofolate synthase/folylpolyglutamate synthase